MAGGEGLVGGLLWSSISTTLCDVCFSHSVFTVSVVSSVFLVTYLAVIGVQWQENTTSGNALLFHGRFILYYVVISIGCILTLPILALRPKNVANTLLIHPFARLASYLLGIEWELQGEEILGQLSGRIGSGKLRGAVFIANHQSTLDSLGVMYFWDKFHPMATVIKKEIFYIWPFGLAAYLAGSIYIDRSRGKSAVYSIEAMVERAAKDNVRIFIFPEGTRNRANMSWGGDPSHKGVLPFKSGAFRAAVSTGLPLVPVIYSPYTFVDEKRLFFGRGKAVMKVLPEIPTDGLTSADIPALMEKSRNVIQDAYKSLTKEMLSSVPPGHLLFRKKYE